MAKEYTLKEVKAANKAAGFYFFSKDTMQFFNSKIETSKTFAGGYFVDSIPDSINLGGSSRRLET